MRSRTWLLLVGITLLGAVLVRAEDAAKKCDLKGAGQVAWKCPKCDKLYLDGTLQEATCPKCRESLLNVPACVKIGYVCDEHKVCAQAAGTCSTCGKELIETPFPSEIYYKCPKCGGRDPAGHPGECPDCHEFRVKTCSLSGTCPHLPSPKEEEKPGDEGKDEGKEEGGK